jgi:hypothetical protein
MLAGFADRTACCILFGLRILVLEGGRLLKSGSRAGRRETKTKRVGINCDC